MTKKFLSTRELALCGAFAGIMVIISQISIPLGGGVPLTLQTFAVCIAGVCLGAKLGFMSVLTYVLLGAVGLPVFANFTGGMNIILGPTGGFIISFPVMAYIIGYVSERTNKGIYIFMGMIAGTIVNFVVGQLFFMKVTGMGFYPSFAAAVLPFIPTSILKALLATYIGLKIKERLRFL